MAQPEFGYLDKPRYAPDGSILFALCDAVNGDYGGNIGAGIVDAAKNGQQRVFFAPEKEHGLYSIVLQFDVTGDVCPVLCMRPLSSGTFLAKRLVTSC